MRVEFAVPLWFLTLPFRLPLIAFAFIFGVVVFPFNWETTRGIIGDLWAGEMR